MRTNDFDIAIVGSGSAAFSGAIRASELGARVAMVERGTVGGTCVNIGCIPSKAELAAAAQRHRAARNPFPGVTTSADGVDLGALVAGKDEIVRSLRQERYLDLVEHYGFELVTGTGQFADPDTLLVDGQPLRADHYLLATGASPAAPPVAGLDEVGYLTSTTALELTELPERLVVIGGNYVGLEFAQLFARLGSEVTVVELLDRLAPFEEPEASEVVANVFASEGIRVVTGARVESVSRRAGEKVVHATVGGSEQHFRTEEVLVATGRRANTSLLALERAGIATNGQGQVIVHPTLRTSNPRVFAAGDVTPAPQFVYVAAAMGAAAAENALGEGERAIDYSALPRITFTSPQIAAVGLTDEQANEQGIECSCRTLPLDYVPRALVERDTRGLAKLVIERGTRRIIGATVVAEGAGDVILAAVYAVQFGLTVDQVVGTWAPYLTMSEAFKLAAQAVDRQVAHLSCCA
ncbi:MAG TPA: mercury(II) reductase [Gaiellaceae bacterium]|nr:mercury(II) reductase [Gaiellaceae bacterium]